MSVRLLQIIIMTIDPFEKLIQNKHTLVMNCFYEIHTSEISEMF